MRNENFIPSKVEPVDSDDSAVHGYFENDGIALTSDSGTSENITEDSDSNFSAESENDEDIECESLNIVVPNGNYDTDDSFVVCVNDPNEDTENDETEDNSKQDEDIECESLNIVVPNGNYDTDDSFVVGVNDPNEDTENDETEDNSKQDEDFDNESWITAVSNGNYDSDDSDDSSFTHPSKEDTNVDDTIENSKQGENHHTESNTEADDIGHNTSSPADPEEINTDVPGSSKQNDIASTSKDDAGRSGKDSDCESTSSEEADATMEEIFGIKPNQEALKNRPPDLKATTSILDICFHPETDLLAAASINGDTVIYSYSVQEVKEVSRLSHHKTSCRQVCYNYDGTLLYTVSKDKSLSVVDTQNSAVKIHIKEAHCEPIYSFFEVDNNLCATGDDDGVVKLWDLRKPREIFDFKCSEQTVTSLLACEEGRFLSATLADGSLTGFNLRRNRVEAQSEMFDSEFNCQSLLKSGTRLAVGTECGVIHIFKWGYFGYKMDAISGIPDAISCQGTLTDRLIIAGCEDGNIRAVHLYPHRFLGIIGQHKDLGVENLSISRDGTYLASCSKEDVFFWNIDYLYEMKTPPEKKGRKKKAAGMRNMQSSRKRNRHDFFRDFPARLPSDDDEGGPVTGISYQSD